jgi:hypothetical protein
MIPKFANSASLNVYNPWVSKVVGCRETPARFFCAVKAMIALVAELHFVCEVS